jgi:hypothetical protein
MSEAVPAFPQSNSDDPVDVCDSLDTGAALWRNGDQLEALRWLRRARDFADEAGNDRRALELARVAADLSSVASAPVREPVTNTPSELRRSKLPEQPLSARKFSGATDAVAASKIPQTASATKPQLTASATKPQLTTLAVASPTTTNQPPSLRPTAPSQRSSTVPRPQGHDRASAVPPQPATATATSEHRTAGSTVPRPGEHERGSVAPTHPREVTSQAENEAGLVSVSVRVSGVENDGSFRVYPMAPGTAAAPASQGVLVLSEKLWATLNRR